jgi:hypothetical protein
VFAGAVDDATKGSTVLLTLVAGTRVGQVRAVVCRSDIFVNNLLQEPAPVHEQATVWTMLKRSIVSTLSQCRNQETKHYYTAREECLYKAAVWHIQRLVGDRITSHVSDFEEVFRQYEPDLGTLAVTTKRQIPSLYYDLDVLWQGKEDDSSYSFFSPRQATVAQLRTMLSKFPRPKPGNGKVELDDDDDEVTFMKMERHDPPSTAKPFSTLTCSKKTKRRKLS